MKNSLLVIALLVTLSATAQQTPQLRLANPGKFKKTYPSPVLEQPIFKADTIGDQYRRLLEANSRQNSLLSRATYSHTTSRGKVYTMPYDNMPCLVPDIKQVRPMPTQPMPGYRMPNAVPEQPLIPKEEDKGNK